jgi:hypothetical protein
MSWHVDPDVLDRYQSGIADRISAASVEAHLTACADCRGLVPVEAEWLKRSWTRIADLVEPGHRLPVERFLTLVGAPAHLARVMAVTPSLRPSWLIAVTLTLLFAALASRVDPSTGFDLFLVLAPLVPVAGVAIAYGRIGDPAHEITVATPVDPFRLLLLRAAIVTGFALVVALNIDIGIPAPYATGLWILPALAVTLSTLAVGTRLTMWLAAAASATGWLLVATLFTVENGGHLIAALTSQAQFAFVAVAVAATFVLLRNGDAYRRGDSD